MIDQSYHAGTPGFGERIGNPFGHIRDWIYMLYIKIFITGPDV